LIFFIVDGGYALVQTEIYVGVIVAIASAAIIYYFASAGKREKEAVTEKPMVERAHALVREVEKEEEVTAPEVAIDLTELRGIGPKRAEKLKVAGIKDVKGLAESNPGNVAKALGFSEKRSSRLVSEALSLRV
jgi:predicted flap endonuclease-1-like 5' DNA nuclease